MIRTNGILQGKDRSLSMKDIRLARIAIRSIQLLLGRRISISNL